MVRTLTLMASLLLLSGCYVSEGHSVQRTHYGYAVPPAPVVYYRAAPRHYDDDYHRHRKHHGKKRHGYHH